MLIYDRRRCRPMPNAEVRRRLTLAQRAKLSWLESTGWELMFVRGEPGHAFIRHDAEGQAAITADGRVLTVRSLTARASERPTADAVPVVAAA
ncbi:hypothetical protein [Lysobacter xanthus]